MNYLGHAYLSFGQTDLLLGNMIGDYVKGNLSKSPYTSAVQKGIDLHRKIDSFTDTHSATLRAKICFRADYGLYAGPIMDTLYDHFLANDPMVFKSQQDLNDFAQNTYKTLATVTDSFPEPFAKLFPYMQQQNWLLGYRAIKGMENALHGLSRRAQHMPEPTLAYQIFVSNYYLLNQCYFELIEDLIKFVKIELNK